MNRPPHRISYRLRTRPKPRGRHAAFAAARLLFVVLCAGTVPTKAAGEFSSNEVWQGVNNFIRKPLFSPKTRLVRLSPPDQETGVWQAQLQPSGFILINPDDSDLPIIGFSGDSSLSLEASPHNSLRAYLRAKRAARRCDARGSSAWHRLSRIVARLSATEPATIITEPLIETRWTQWKFYNGMCPEVSNALYGYDERAPVGCVATALAQLLRFYSWPAAGHGVRTYTDAAGESQGSYTYDFSRQIPWDLLKDHYDLFCGEDPSCTAAIAQLMFSMDVAAEMDFEAGGSSSSLLTVVANASKYLGYTSKGYISTPGAQFANALRSELQANQVLLVDINVPGGGHEVLADGLASDADIGYVHLNYGWDGQNDGWYSGYDSASSPMFTGLMKGFRPNVGTQSLLACGPNYIELVATNGSQNVEIRVRASGQNSLAYVITPSHDWIYLANNSGAAGSAVSRHQVTINSAGLAPGVHDAYLEVTGSAPNLPRRIIVRLYKPAPPTIAQEPADSVTESPASALLSITATPGRSFTPCPLEGPVSYQWYRNGEPLAGQTRSWLYAGDYGTFQCEVSAFGAMARSREAIVSSPRPWLLALPQPPLAGSNVKRVQLTLHVDPGTMGQIEVSSDLETWSNLGASFTATNAVIYEDVDISEARQFFRVRIVN